MDFTIQLSRVLKRLVDRRYDSQAEWARVAKISKSMASKLVNEPGTNCLWITEEVWERVWDSLSPEIESELGPDCYPRAKWMEYVAKEKAEREALEARQLAEAGELLANGDFPDEIHELVADYVAIPDDKRKLISQIIKTYLPPKQNPEGQE